METTKTTTNKTTFTTSREAARFEVKDQDNGKLPILSGYCMVWGKPGDMENLSDDRRGYRVRLLAGSATPTDPCLVYANHDPACTMASTKSATVKFTPDDYGMRFEVDPVDATYSRDIIANARRGD